MNRAMTYRKRSDTVEAIQVTPTNTRDLAKWCGGRVVEEVTDQKKDLSIVVPTLQGNMRAHAGDWILRHPDGTFEQVNGDYFDTEYVRA